MKKYRIAFVNTIFHGRVDYLPTGLCYLTAYLKKHIDEKIEVKIFNIYESNYTKLLDFKPNFIGFTSFTHNYNIIRRIAGKIKATNPEIKLAIGGPHITMAPWSMDKVFDYAMIGEGEAVTLQMINHLIDGDHEAVDNLGGIQIMKGDTPVLNPHPGNIPNLDDIPFPDREVVDGLETIITADHANWFNRSGLRTMQLTTSRGCPYKCFFCQPSIMWGKYRMHSPEYIASEIEYIHNKFGISAILIEDDLFTGNKKRVAKVIDLLGSKDLLNKIVYYAGARTSQIDDDWVRLFKELGIVKVEFGIESGSDEVAAYLKKGKSSAEVNKKAISMLNENGIAAFGSFIAGAPPEKMSDLKQTYKLIKWIKKNDPRNTCGIGIATPLPGTGLWNEAVEKGIIKQADIDWDKLASLDRIPTEPEQLYYINEHIPPKKLLKSTKMMNFKMWVGSPKEFVSALPRRGKKLYRKLRNKILK